MKRRAMIGGAAYPSPSTIAVSDGWNPPIQSIPVIEHMNFPAIAIAPYIPKQIIHSIFLRKINQKTQVQTERKKKKNREILNNKGDLFYPVYINY